MTHEEELMNRTSRLIERAYAISLWNEFYDEVRHKNRFFPHSAFVEKYIHPLADGTETDQPVGGRQIGGAPKPQ